MFRRACCFVGAWCVVSLLGCSTYEQRVADVRQTFYAGNLDRAAQTIDKSLKHPRHDADVLKLERAMVDLTAGKPQQAEQALREVRDRFDFLEQKSLGESALAMLTDDNRKSYAGEDYEKILIRAFLAISNLMNGGQDAQAYSLQITDKQQQIVNTFAEEISARSAQGGVLLTFGRITRGASTLAADSNIEVVSGIKLTRMLRASGWESSRLESGASTGFGNTRTPDSRHGR